MSAGTGAGRDGSPSSVSVGNVIVRTEGWDGRRSRSHSQVRRAGFVSPCAAPNLVLICRACSSGSQNQF